MPNPDYPRRSLISTVVMFAVWPLVMVMALSTYFGMANDPLTWLPEEAPQQRSYRQFREWFGSDDVVLISWEGCLLDDDRLPTLATQLVQGPETGRYVKDVTSGSELIDRLALPPHDLTRATAIDRFRGTLIGIDGSLTCLFLTMTEDADSHRQAALQAIQRTVAAYAEVAPSAVHMVGPFIYRTSLDYESTRNLGWIAIAAILIGLGLTWGFLRRFRLALLTLSCGAFGGGCTIVLVGLTGGRMSPVMLVMPTLVFVLATSAAIHLINYYRDAAGETAGQEAVAIAVRRAWKPCWYAALTTAIGLVSLGISQVRPVQAFGFYSAVGVVGSLVLVFLILPGVLQRWPPRQKRARGGGLFDWLDVNELVSSQKRARGGGLFDWLEVSELVSRHRWSILLGGAAVSCFFASGLLRVETSARIGDLFAGHTRIIGDYEWLESRFGPLDPIEITVRFDEGEAWSMVEQLELVTDLAAEIDALAESGGTISAASFLPRLPVGSTVRQTAKRAVFNRLLGREQQMLMETKYFQAEGGRRIWRIRTQVAALGDLAYDRFIRQIEAATLPTLRAQETSGRTPPTLGFTGLPLLTQAVQQRLLYDLFRSYLMAFIVISLVICVMQKSVGMGVVAMIPNLFPAVAVFGIMGWLGQPVDIGAMVTASVALGIAVDDTLHFMIWYRHGRQRGETCGDAVTTAYRRCATAMVHTTLICGLALLPHAASSCVPVSRFAWLMLSLLAAALVGDLLLLPAILLRGSHGDEQRGFVWTSTDDA